MPAKKKAASKKVTTKKAKVKKITRVALVIDRSGSMSVIRRQAWSGINEQLKLLKDNAKKGGDTTVSYVQFDTEIETLFANKKAQELQQIKEHEYEPRGGTALYDALGQTIVNLSGLPETDDTGYLVVVISDGEENSSKDWKGGALKAKIQELEKTGKWTFTYMLSNVDIGSVQTNLGAHAGNISTFVSTPTGMTYASTVISTSSQTYLQQRSKGISGSLNFYNNAATTSGKSSNGS